jgi:hypothetical protein
VVHKINYLRFHTEKKLLKKKGLVSINTKVLKHAKSRNIYSENGNFQIVGFYSGNGGGQDGVFNLVYTKYYEIINDSKTEFLREFIVQHESDKVKKRAEKNAGKGKELEMYAYTIDEIVENYDSSVTMIAEQYFE